VIIYVFNISCAFSWNKKKEIDCKNAWSWKLQNRKYQCLLWRNYFLHIIIQKALNQKENPVLKYSRLYTLHVKWDVKCAICNNTWLLRHTNTTAHTSEHTAKINVSELPHAFYPPHLESNISIAPGLKNRNWKVAHFVQIMKFRVLQWWLSAVVWKLGVQWKSIVLREMQNSVGHQKLKIPNNMYRTQIKQKA